MSAQPIIFSTPMVRAILDGRKTQTRRPLKPQPPEDDPPITQPRIFAPQVVRRGEYAPGPDTFGVYGESWHRTLYPPGTELWVREAWQQANNQAHYRADGYHVHFPWRSPIHMPRWASRITLRVTDVRVQRVQEISREDELAEGARPGEFFDSMWDSIHAKHPDHRWEANPWVCAISFRREP